MSSSLRTCAPLCFLPAFLSHLSSGDEVALPTAGSVPQGLVQWGPGGAQGHFRDKSPGQEEENEVRPGLVDHTDLYAKFAKFDNGEQECR